MDLFDQTLKDQIAQIHKNLFDTYKRPTKMRFYMKGLETVVYDPSFNPDFDTFEGNLNQYTPVFADFDVCLIYLDRQEYSDFIKGEDTNIRYKAIYNRIKIQVEEDAFQYLKDAERFVFGDEKYAIELSWRKLGAFSFQFYEIILQRVV